MVLLDNTNRSLLNAKNPDGNIFAIRVGICADHYTISNLGRAGRSTILAHIQKSVIIYCTGD